jgi:hypothetical protein
MNDQNSIRNSAESIPVDLTAFDANYAEAQVRRNNPLPDGKYRVRVENVELTRSSNGNSILKWDLLVLDGQFTGRHLFKTAAITAASLPVIKSDLLTLGLKLATFSSLPEHLESLIGKKLLAIKRTKTDFVNVYFSK